MRVIGIGGRKGSGKDPAALIIAGAQENRTQIIRLSTGLKRMLAGLYGVPHDSPPFETSEGKQQPSPRPLKPGNTVRDDLIDLGDKTRELYRDIWVTDTIQRATEFDAETLVIPDVRYPNERAHCDLLLWVGPDEKGEHPTEAALSQADATDGWVFDTGEGVAADLVMLRDKLLHIAGGTLI